MPLVLHLQLVMSPTTHFAYGTAANCPGKEAPTPPTKAPGQRHNLPEVQGGVPATSKFFLAFCSFRRASGDIWKQILATVHSNHHNKLCI